MFLKRGYSSSEFHRCAYFFFRQPQDRAFFSHFLSFPTLSPSLGLVGRGKVTKHWTFVPGQWRTFTPAITTDPASKEDTETLEWQAASLSIWALSWLVSSLFCSLGWKRATEPRDGQLIWVIYAICSKVNVMFLSINRSADRGWWWHGLMDKWTLGDDW